MSSAGPAADVDRQECCMPESCLEGWQYIMAVLDHHLGCVENSWSNPAFSQVPTTCSLTLTFAMFFVIKLISWPRQTYVGDKEQKSRPSRCHLAVGWPWERKLAWDQETPSANLGWSLLTRSTSTWQSLSFSPPSGGWLPADGR